MGTGRLCLWESAEANCAQVFRNPDLVGDVDEYCAPPPRGRRRCSGANRHAALVIPPATSRRMANFFHAFSSRCPAATCRTQKFMDIWHDSTQLNEVRSIRARDLPVCSTAVMSARAPAARLGLHGRKHARPFFAGLRKVVCPNRNCFGKHDSEAVPAAHALAGADFRVNALTFEFLPVWLVQPHCTNYPQELHKLAARLNRAFYAGAPFTLSRVAESMGPFSTRGLVFRSLILGLQSLNSCQIQPARCTICGNKATGTAASSQNGSCRHEKLLPEIRKDPTQKDWLLHVCELFRAIQACISQVRTDKKGGSRKF